MAEEVEHQGGAHVAAPTPAKRPPLTWILNQKTGKAVGFHTVCARWMDLKTNTEGHEPAYTEICRICGTFLIDPPRSMRGKPKLILDVETLII